MSTQSVDGLDANAPRSERYGSWGGRWKAFIVIEKWWAVKPHKQRLAFFNSCVFVIILGCILGLLPIDYKEAIRNRQDLTLPTFIQHLGTTAANMTSEGEASAAFVINQTNATLAAMTVAQNALSYAFGNTTNFYQQSWRTMRLAPSYPIEFGTVLTEEGIGTITGFRAQMAVGQVQSSTQRVREYFSSALKRVLVLMSRYAASFRAKEIKYIQVMNYHALTAIAFHCALSQRYLDSFFLLEGKEDTAEVIAARKQMLKEVYVNMQTADAVSSYLLEPMLSEQTDLIYTLRLRTRQLYGGMELLMNRIVLNQVASDIDAQPQVSMKPALAELYKMQESIDTTEPNVSGENHYIAYFVLGSIAFITAVLSIAQYICFRSTDAKRTATDLRNANVMHDVLVRVSEHVQEMATFSLKPPPPPRSMLGTAVGVVEIQLQNCLASLRALAPTIPALMFQERVRADAAELSEVKDPATMTLVDKPRATLAKEKLALLTSHDRDAEAAALALRMQEKTDLQEDVNEVALVFFSLVAFQDASQQQSIDLAMTHFRTFVTAVEECVYEFGGTVLSVGFGRLVAVWCPSDSSAHQAQEHNLCEQAASCALVFSARTKTLQKYSKTLRENLPIHIGVVGGAVKRGIFGCEEYKNMLLLGPPLLRGMYVAQANRYHMTTVACDEYVRQSISRVYLCKPIELIPEGGCVFEIMHESNRGEPEKEAQLQVYNKAFDLFAKRYYREALKAFRAYTKQYGYDSSVERIQALITGLSEP